MTQESTWLLGKQYCPKNGFQSDRFRLCDFFYVCCFYLSHLGHCEIGLNRRETCQFKCFLASFNLFKVLQGSFQNEYWHMLTFPTGKYRLILYYPGCTFHFPRATGKRNSRPLKHCRSRQSRGRQCFWRGDDLPCNHVKNVIFILLYRMSAFPTQLQNYLILKITLHTGRHFQWMSSPCYHVVKNATTAAIGFSIRAVDIFLMSPSLL